MGKTRRSVIASIASAIALLASPGAHATGYGPAPSQNETQSDTQPESQPVPQAAAATPRLDERSKPLGIGDDQANQDKAAGAATGAGWGLRTALALLAVLSLIFVGATVVRRLAVFGGDLACSLGPGGRAPSGVLSVLGRYPVGGGERLVLLKVDRRVLLLSQSVGRWRSPGSGFRTLCEISDPEEVASILVKSRDEQGDSIADRFRSLLQGEAAGHESDYQTQEGRRVEVSGEGDTAEFWDESRAGRVLAGHQREGARW